MHTVHGEMVSSGQRVCTAVTYHTAKDGLACYFTRGSSGVRGMITVMIRGAWALNLA